MILLIDNYDSFSYNLYQLIGTVQSDIEVVRNDVCTIEGIRKLNPQAIILSPGPGKPSEAGICEEVVRQLAGEVKILGVCLGHQAICEVYGGVVTYAKQMMHGKSSVIDADTKSRLFQNMKPELTVARYHSLAAVPESMPKELRVTAKTKEGEIMAVEHITYPVYGVQFHPESVLTPEGKQIIVNFLED